MMWTLMLERKALIKLNPQKVRKALAAIAGAAERNERRGFAAEVIDVADSEEVTEDGTRKACYRARLRLEENKARTAARAQARYEKVLTIVTRRAERLGWRVVSQEGSAQLPEGGSSAPDSTPRPPFQLPDLTPEAFQGIYERDAHIRLIHDAMQTYVSTEGRKASHVLLYGEPAAAKTSLLQRFKAFYEQGGEVERVVFIDAQTMTRAGLEDWLLDRAERSDLPEVLVVEELEK
jgi:hypothetical protein